MTWLSLAACAVLLLLAVLIVRRLQMKPRFPYLGAALSAADYAQLAQRPGWRAKRVSVAPGIELRGLERAPQDPAGPWVFFLNGNSAHLLAEAQQTLDALCAPRGWGSFAYAYRGFDSSAGAPTPAALERDSLEVYRQFLLEHQVLPSAVHIVAFSIGTAVATAWVAQAAGAPPASLSLLAPMTVLYMGGRRQLQLHRYETLKWLGRIATPTLVFHGTEDRALPVANGRTVAATLAARGTFIEGRGLGHEELFLAPAAQAAVIDFISQHIRA